MSNRLGGYDKNNIQFKRFLPNVDLAIEQEKQFKQDVDEILNHVGSNIGTLILKMKKS